MNNHRNKNIKDTDKSSVRDISCRRDSRLMSIIGIIAVMTTICSFLFRCAKTVISEFPESGFLYYVLTWSIFLIPLSGFISILIRIIFFIVVDFSRFNVLDERYKEYDRKSDEKYSTMIKDFKIILGIILCGELILSVTENLIASWGNNVVCIVFLAGATLFITAVIIKKKIRWTQIWSVIKRLLELSVIEAIIIFFVMVLFYSPRGKVDVTFDEQGTILIQNAVNENPEKEVLYIYNEAGCILEEIDITEAVVLRALTTAGQTIKNYKGSELGTAQKAYGEMLYWKYLYDIEDLKLGSGKYLALIEIVQGQNNVQIFNTFEVADSKYCFAVNTIHKEY